MSGRTDPPGARRIAVAVELQRRDVVVGAPSSGDGQALTGLYVADLVGAAARRGDPPRARRIAVAVELQRLHVVLGAAPSGDGQALEGLRVADLIDAGAGRVAGHGTGWLGM